MKRVVVIGQPGSGGPLSCGEFAHMLAMRLGIRHFPLGQARAEPHDAVHAALHAHEHWIATEPAGVFTEPVFRRADTIVWLHFSPLPFLRDWAARLRDALSRPAAPTDRGPRARLHDVSTAFAYLMAAPQMYKLIEHPALAHARVHELRTPRQAEFWLMMQRRHG